MEKPVIAIIGAGNMGRSLIGGFIRQGISSDTIYVADSNQEKKDALKTQYHIQVSANNHEAIQSANVVIIAVKPQHVKAVVVDIQSIVLKNKPLIISIAAGISAESIASWLGNSSISIIRGMPNTPALIGAGITALHANAHVTPAQKTLAETLLKTVGEVVWVHEPHLMDAVTALSGSGPAYFFLIMEALQSAGEQLGLRQDIARRLTLQTALGAARMAIETGDDLAVLRKHVTSPGGTTEKGIHVLEERHIRDVLKAALIAAKERSAEIANQLDKE